MKARTLLLLPALLFFSSAKADNQTVLVDTIATTNTHISFENNVASEPPSTEPTDSVTPENTLTIDAQLLSRGEIRRGGLPKVEGETPKKANFVFERSRLAIDYQRHWLNVHLTAQHTSVWGQKGNGTLNLYEAWAMLKSKQGLFLQLGRQELNYDDERILGRNDWAMAALSHDALRFGYEGKGHKVHGILAYNQKPENMNGGTVYTTTDGAQPYKTMQTLWYHYDVPKLPLSVSLLFMNTGLEGIKPTDEGITGLHFQQLFGGYIHFNPKHWDAQASLYLQRGEDEFGIPIKAYMGSMKLTYIQPSRFSVYSGYDYLSGDDNPIVPKPGAIGLTQHKKVGGFSTIYGSHHQFYGAMDFFYLSAYYGSYTPGLQNVFVGGTYYPIKNISLTASYHYLAVASEVRKAAKTLGHEVDISASYNIIKDVNMSLGYTYMYGTDTLQRLQRVDGNKNLHWAWIMFAVNPGIFSIKW